MVKECQWSFCDSASVVLWCVNFPQPRCRLLISISPDKFLFHRLLHPLELPGHGRTVICIPCRTSPRFLPKQSLTLSRPLRIPSLEILSMVTRKLLVSVLASSPIYLHAPKILPHQVHLSVLSMANFPSSSPMLFTAQNFILLSLMLLLSSSSGSKLAFLQHVGHRDTDYLYLHSWLPPRWSAMTPIPTNLGQLLLRQRSPYGR